MSCAGFSSLPEDILSDIYHRVAEDYLKQDDGFKQCSKLAGALPCFQSLSLPRAPLERWARKGLSWEDIKWALLRQPSASLVHIIVLKEDPGRDRDCVVEECQAEYTWKGLVHEGEEDSDEELKGLMKVSEDKRGFRALVLKVFPRYEDDADKFTLHRTSQRLRPLVDKLLQLGVAGLQSLKISADIIDRPKVLGQLPLRHLELEIEKSSTVQLKKIMAALGQCTALEYLIIAGSIHYNSREGLPDLSLRKAPSLKHVHLRGAFPEGRLFSPPECKLRIDLDDYPKSWDKVWQGEHGRELMGSVPAMCLDFSCRRLPSWSPTTQDFKVLQYLQLQCPKDFTDLARLESIPHVRLKLHSSQNIILHTRGSWQSLEVYKFEGFEIDFADIDAFVRDNPKFLFGTFKVTKVWRNMNGALYAASKRQGTGCFPHKAADGDYSRSLSNIKGVVDLWCDKHLCRVEDFWPSQSMQSCLAQVGPRPKIIRVPSLKALPDIVDDPDTVNVSNPKRPLSLAANPEAMSTHTHRKPARQRKLWGRLMWLALKLNPIRNCTQGV